MDVLVLGGGLAGLSAAIYAKQKGHTVTLLEKNDDVGGKLWQFAKDGYIFDMGPSMIIEPWIIDEVLAVAGKKPLLMHRVKPTFEVYYDGENTVVDQEYLDELLQTLPDRDQKAFRKMQADMDVVIKEVRASFFDKPVKGFWSVLNPHLLRIASKINPRLSAAEHAEKTFESPLLRALLSTYPSYSEHPIHKSPAIALFVPFLMLKEGIFYPEGGVQQIALAMKEAAIEMGVTIKTGVAVEKIISKGDLVRGVLADKLYEPDAVISAMDFAYTQTLLGRTVQKEAAHAYVALALGIKKQLPFSHHTFIIPKNYHESHKEIDAGKIPHSFPVYCCVASKTDTNIAPHGCENMLVVAVLPNTQHIDWASEKASLQEQMIRIISEETGIDVSQDIEVSYMLAPDEFERRFNNTGGSVFGLSGVHNPFVGFREHNKDKELKNLYYCGATVQPGSGVPLVIRSGKFAADLLPAK